jgi:Flp pilus assembly pilin Flp
LPSTIQPLAQVWAKREEGQTAAEYAVVLGVIVVVTVTTFTALGDAAQNLIGRVVALFS